MTGKDPSHSLPSPTSLPPSTHHSKKRKRDKSNNPTSPPVKGLPSLKKEPSTTHGPPHTERKSTAELDVVKGDGDGEVTPRQGKRQRQKKRRQQSLPSRSHTAEAQTDVSLTPGTRVSLTPAPENRAASLSIQHHKASESKAEDAIAAKYMNIKAEKAHTKSSSPLKDVSAGVNREKERETTNQEKAKWKEREAKLLSFQQQVEASRDRAQKETEELKSKVQELEEKMKKQQEEVKAKDEVIEGHEKVREQLREAITCGVCFEPLNDPHILSCGHIACRSCLASWFRTSGAYVHKEKEDGPIPDDLNLEYWTKVCHTCRAHITARPSRVYHLAGILGPLGIDAHIPAPPTDPKENPWKNIFPLEKSRYLIFDAGDDCDRCPDCCAEVVEGECQGCGAAFSIHGGDDLDDFMSDLDEDDGEILGSDISDGDAREMLFGIRGPGDGSASEEDEGSEDGADHRRRNRRGNLDGANDTGARRRRPAAEEGSLSGASLAGDDEIEEDSDESDSERGETSEAGERRGNRDRQARDGRRRRQLAPTPDGTDHTRRSNGDIPRNARRIVQNRLNGQRDRNAARAERASNRAGQPERERNALPASVAGLLDLFAEDDGDDNMTDDDGEGSLGESGDYLSEDEDSYECSFIDDGPEGVSNDEDANSGDDDDDGSDGDQSDGHDSLMGEVAQDDDGGSGDETDEEEMRVRRLRRFGGQSRSR